MLPIICLGERAIILTVVFAVKSHGVSIPAATTEYAAPLSSFLPFINSKLSVRIATSADTTPNYSTYDCLS